MFTCELVGGILWNLCTWLLGLPSSSSHALFGGLIGAGIASGGLARVNWDGLFAKVLIPALASPFVAGLVAVIGTFFIYMITRSVTSRGVVTHLAGAADQLFGDSFDFLIGQLSAQECEQWLIVLLRHPVRVTRPQPCHHRREEDRPVHQKISIPR